MLQKVMEYVHNMFIVEPYPGEYTITDGVLSPSVSLKEGQRFWIVGSALNDGVYTYHSDGIQNDDDDCVAGLRDETWTGTICALAVPPAVIALSGAINEWVAKHGEIVNSPYTSESVLGVYSYTKANGKNGAGGTASWQDVFASQLKRWRKVAIL